MALLWSRAKYSVQDYDVGCPTSPSKDPSVGEAGRCGPTSLLFYIYLPQLGHDHRRQGIALDVWLQKKVPLPRVPKRHPGGVIDNHLFRLIVQVESLLNVPFYSRLFQQCVHLEIAVAAVVDLAIRVEQYIQIVLRIGVVG